MKNTTPKKTTNITSTTSKYILLKESRIHHKGVFAKINIPKGTKIIQYVGERLTKKQSEKRADETLEKAKQNHNNGAVYIFELDKKTDIDGDVPYNTAKYINHSCNPNCETEIIDKEIWIISLKDIKKGEELTYNYGYDIDHYLDHPCKCGSKNCIGFIAEQNKWTKLDKKIKTKLQNKKILVAYYSRTNITAKATETLKRFNITLERINDEKNREGLINAIKAGYDALLKKETKITFKENPANYDLTIIAGQIWSGTITPAMRTYIQQNKFKKVSAVLTLSGNDPSKAIKDLKLLLGDIEILTIPKKSVKKNTHVSEMIKFILKHV